MATRMIPNRYLLDSRGKPKAVVLSIATYRRLVHLLGDLSDAAALKQAIRSSRGTVAHDQLLARLKQQRLI